MFCVTSVLPMFSINRSAVSRCETLEAPAGDWGWLPGDSADFDALLAAFVVGCCSSGVACGSSFACSDAERKIKAIMMLRSGKLMRWALKGFWKGTKRWEKGEVGVRLV